ncbi:MULTISPECIES: bifunctional glutamate N-acetyltransferase/amino-acid acetyltransferase ArgJ [Myxococcaceae]|uniref:bifunctional glutamate N-acetyltransferase/amino-acid acetyltransferase ArgJ n=1 Tax=Myxococcaceae TaxID=31 RepID=UPI001890138B|nr:MULTISPECIES: bifunctional glutamate N-acetyltransferase/amino-acid acetyltransferase ArgJ [Myxococcaceae]MBF5046649.1 bifunctional glutamate N-acetyltransferase/amino-acid acetyltransferase ArgJ [Simulacricoccus sp. 17bor-14]
MSIPVPPVPSFPPAALTLTSVPGLRAAGVRAGIKASGNPDVGLLVADEAVPAAGLFTQNHFAAAPVLLSREHLAKSGGRVRAVVVNSGNANACTGEDGARDAREMCTRVAGALGCPVEQVLVCSTGVIGVKLPMDRVRAGIDAALAQLAGDVEAGRRFLHAIMTTDAYPKEACARLGRGVVAGICKGAGMIEPNMATMLGFLSTDLQLSPAELQAALPRLAAGSFNAVHVDTHTSTNDTLLLLATGRTPRAAGWEEAAAQVAHRLAWLIARDGEGATKVTTIEVTGAESDAAAREIAKLVAASALVRTALYGNDPNWGRFTSQVGNARAVRNARALTCVLQGIEVFRGGEPTAFDRAAASRAMAQEDVRLELRLADGPGRAVVLTSDLGYRYVQVNAEYTT